MNNGNSFVRTLVAGAPEILTSGKTQNLGLGQIGIFDGETYDAVTAPTFGVNSSIIIAQGQKPKLGALMGGLTGSRSEKTEIIKGHLIKSWKGYRGGEGKQAKVAVGYDGADITKTITFNKGQLKHLYIKMTGLPVNKLFRPDGVVLRYTLDGGANDECGVDFSECTVASDIEGKVDELIKKINADTKSHAGFIKLSKLRYCASGPSLTTTTYNRYQLVIVDNGSDAALGLVQAKYPGYEVWRDSRNDATQQSTYNLIATSLPSAYTREDVYIPNCTSCATGYTSAVGGYIWKGVIEDANADISAALKTKIDAITDAASTVVKISNDNYLIVLQVEATSADLEAAIEAGSTYTVTSLTYKEQSGSTICIENSPSSTAWTLKAAGKKVSKEFRITLADGECGTVRTTELATAFAELGTVTAVTGEPSGACSHRYKMSVLSNFLEDGCSIDELTWPAIPGYDGADWVAQSLAAGTDCVVGILIEGAYVNRVTDDVLYGTYPYEADGVHIQVSFANPDYNGPVSESFPPITPLQSFQEPRGFGAAIRPLEELSRGYALQNWSNDPGVRDAEGFQFFTKANAYYDQYTLGFEQVYGVGGFSANSFQKHLVNVYFEEGKGKKFEAAINSYIESNPALGLAPVIL